MLTCVCIGIDLIYLLFKRLNSFNRFLFDCNPFTLFVKKLKFNWFFKFPLSLKMISLKFDKYQKNNYVKGFYKRNCDY